jgi:hypothetical protein
VTQEDSSQFKPALLTKTERDWVSGRYEKPVSKSYVYKMRSTIRKKLQTFKESELPLLFKSGLFPELTNNIEIEPWTGSWPRQINNYNSNLGKAKVLGPNPSQGSFSMLIFSITGGFSGDVRG